MEISANRRALVREILPHWQGIVLRGIIAVLFGILAIIWPGITLFTFLVIFGIFAFADGIVSIVTAIGSPLERNRRWLLLMVGLAGIAAGIVAFAYPGATMFVLLYIIATWAVVTGILHVITAFLGESLEAGSRWLLGLSGALSIMIGILLYAYPLAGLLSVAWLIGFYAIVYGFTLFTLGVYLRGFGQQLRGALQH